MARSSKKGPYIDGHLMKKVDAVKASGRLTPIKTWSRRSVIVPKFVGITFHVHNGKKHIPVPVSEAMIDKKLGEMAPTRTFTGHGSDKKGKK